MIEDQRRKLRRSYPSSLQPVISVPLANLIVNDVSERASKRHSTRSALIHLLRHTFSRLGDLLSGGLHSFAVFGWPFLLEHFDIN
ncbi:hypothetical protein KC330_g17 [Hortaea werneckii]|nr:hypothetical protein KC330_g17 [Hortaea werneckii]